MHPSTHKVFSAAKSLGLEIEAPKFAHTTRSAGEATEAIGCLVAQIVKSLCFLPSVTALILLVSGTNRLSTQKLATSLNVSPPKSKRVNANEVKELTGFSIGYKNPRSSYMDADLMKFNLVWAAEGTPNTVFAISPNDLIRACQATIADLRV